MAHDYRYDPFSDAAEPVSISGETHVIPTTSPYIIRLDEVPQKDSPTSISLTIGGAAATEVSAQPASGQYWPDYSTGADGDESWNTGTILFNSADKGKAVVVSYQGLGTLVDVERTTAIHGVKVFTSSGTWTCPNGVDHVVVSGCGAGGGSGGINTDSAAVGASGGAGGATSFGSLLTLAGGGVGTGGAVNGNGIGNHVVDGTPGADGNSALKVFAPYYGVGGSRASVSSSTQDSDSGITYGYTYSGAGGSGATRLFAPLTVAAGTTYTITIGSGGAGGSDDVSGNAGASGILVLQY